MTMVYDIALLVVGAALGIFSSGVFWWIQSHYLVPRVEFSEEIAHYQTGEDAGIYRVKLKNSGRRRIIDIRIVVRVSIYGLGSRSMWTSFNLVHNSEFVPLLGNPGSKIVNVFDPEVAFRTSTQVTSSVSSEVDKIKDLRELFENYKRVRLRVYLFGYDEFSGAQKMYRSKNYQQRDIRKGVFKGLYVVGSEG